MGRVALAVGFLAAGLAGADDALPSMPSGSGPGRMLCASCAPPTGLTSTGPVAPAAEPGERLAITGTVYQADGTTPAAGVTLFAYQTDATGHYNARDDPFAPRLRAWLTTGADGVYALRTIKPGPYPGRAIPAHIHLHVFGPGRTEASLGDLWFAGDRFLSAAQLARSAAEGRFGQVLALEKTPDGTWRAEHDLRLPPVR